ncbi:Predicted phosphodiesterase [Flavobacterium fluvii]|uniref:Predicted phosphodiesterase n=1 Tax=Flavobacterium fluvii TaxID=468056 RepID=A0A1M5IMR5_9FLAO|nr:metallophosphoesterase family protein [Flavobacterium fluvii]SHG29602.1 Predicted phosphodiesterase [Flavobacterium fluvii]
MKVGVISDIHGNHYALDAVLKSAKKEGIEKILVLGDIVGYYYHPEIVLNMLSEWDCEIIKGNHEVLLQDLKENKIDSEVLKEKYGRGHELALKNIDSETQQWLFSLPVQKSVVIDNVSFQLNHGSPSSIDEYIYPDTPLAQLNKCNSVEHDFVLIGHSHYSFSFRCKNSTLINCGSVGQSRQKGGLAYWVVINTFNKSFKIKATPYDTSYLLEEIKLFESKEGYSSKILIR